MFKDASTRGTNLKIDVRVAVFSCNVDVLLSRTAMHRTYSTTTSSIYGDVTRENEMMWLPWWSILSQPER